MSEIRKKIDQVIKLGIAAYMKESEFKKNGQRLASSSLTQCPN